ncbi:MAG: GNAT family N-acetyltransferase [Planctomycetes bacterium]|nr:GNAT family N-acetyltransferase [Planctomycetota bacterium]
MAKRLAGLGTRRRARKIRSGFNFAISDSLAALSGEAWDGVTRDGDVWMRREYLSVLENHPPENIKLVFALVMRGREPVAAVAAQIAIITGERVNAKAIRKRKSKVIICGNLLSWGPHGVAFKRGEDPAELWKGVGELLYRIRRAERLAGQPAIQIIKDVPMSNSEDLASIRALSYKRVETDPDMVLEIRPAWKKYDDYLASLNSKYRRSVRDIIKDTDDAGFRIERVRDAAAHADVIHNLYLQIHEQAAVRPVTIVKNYIPALAEAFGADFRCTIIRNDRQIAGFITTLRSGDTAIGYYVGVDREINNRVPIYHRLLHITIADAIEMGCGRLSLGRTALEAKARLGARPEPLCVWARHRVGPLNALIGPLLGAIPHGVAPERNPFK